MAKQKARGLQGKEMMSQAFNDKSEQELKTLRSSTSTTLQNDMLRLLEEELHTDLALTNGTDVVKAHLSILQCRLKESWKDQYVSKHRGQDSNTIEVKDVSSTQLRSFVRQLYTVSDAALLMEEFLPFFSGFRSLQETATEGLEDTEKSFQDLSRPNEQADQSSTQNGCLKKGSEYHSDSDGEVEEKTNGEIQHMEEKRESGVNVGVKCQTELDTQSSSLHQAAAESSLSTTSDTGTNSRAGISSESELPCNGTDNELVFSCSNYETSTSENKESLSELSSVDSKPNPHQTCSSLGADLLLMYLNQESCDCCILVDGHKFPAHKSILSARSQYFEAMLGGHWMESQLDVVTLEGVGPQAVKHLLLFLYGGVLALPDSDVSVDLLDLFQVADMYGVSSLNKVLSFYLRRDLCHFFHKPCSSCVLTAADALSLCHNFNLEDLEQRCLKWIAKNFTKIWPSKTFAGLPDNLQQLSLRSLTGQFTPANVLDIIVECDRLTSSLPRVKWTEAVLCLLTQLMDAAIEFTSSNFVRVIKNPEFLQWAQGATWKAGLLKGIFMSAIDSLPIDKACHVFQALLQLQATLKHESDEEEVSSESSQVGDEVAGLLDAMVQRCERFLRMHIHKVMRSSQWAEIPKPVQARIMETSAYLSLADLPDPKPRPVARKPVTVRHVVPPRPMPGLQANRPRARGTPPRALSSVPVVRGHPTGQLSGRGQRQLPSSQGLSTSRTSDRQSPSSQGLSTNRTNDRQSPSSQGLSTNRTSDRQSPLSQGLSTNRTSDRQSPSSQGLSTNRTSDRQSPNTGGARLKSNTGSQAVDPLHRGGNSRTPSNRPEQGTAQMKCGGKVSSSNRELQAEKSAEKMLNKTNSDSDNVPGSLSCESNISNEAGFEENFTRETDISMLKSKSEENSDVFSNAVSGCKGGACSKVSDTPGDVEISGVFTDIFPTNSFEQALPSHEGDIMSVPQSTPLDHSDYPQTKELSTAEHLEDSSLTISRTGVDNNPDLLDIHRDQKSPSQEPSPRLRTSRLPVATSSLLSRSPRQRWSVGSTESFDRQQFHYKTEDAQVDNVSGPDLFRSMSLPPEGQADRTIKTRESAVGTGNSLAPSNVGTINTRESAVGTGSTLAPSNVSVEIIPGEIKIVKMSRPLSIGFVVPSS